MSNILIIKHGSLGDLIQANGAIKDIKQFYKNSSLLISKNRIIIFLKILLGVGYENWFHWFRQCWW